MQSSQLNCIFSFRFNTETVSSKLFENHLIWLWKKSSQIYFFFFEVILLFMSLKVCYLITLLYLHISARQIMMKICLLSAFVWDCSVSQVGVIVGLKERRKSFYFAVILLKT